MNFEQLNTGWKVFFSRFELSRIRRTRKVDLYEQDSYNMQELNDQKTLP